MLLAISIFKPLDAGQEQTYRTKAEKFSGLPLLKLFQTKRLLLQQEQPSVFIKIVLQPLCQCLFCFGWFCGFWFTQGPVFAKVHQDRSCNKDG
jgi:hypothetical protein